MPPKRDDATASEKMLGLYTLLLLSTRAWSLGELAEQFRCSKPTVLRLLQKIERLEGVRLNSETRPAPQQGRRTQKWYMLERSRRSDARCMGLSPDEMRLLHLCRDIAAPFLPNELRTVLDSSLRRASLLLPTETDMPESAVPVAQPALLGSIDYGPFQGILQTLLGAMESKHICEIVYAPHGTPERTHEMAVTGLVSGRQTLYLRGWRVTDKGKPQALHPMFLAVHRIRGVTLTRRAHALSSPPEEAGFGIMDGEPFRVRVRIMGGAAAYARDRVFGPDQTLDEVEGGIVLAFTARSEPEVLAWVFSFTSAARVLEPDWLADKAQSELRAMLHNYQERQENA